MKINWKLIDKITKQFFKDWKLKIRRQINSSK